MPHTIRGTCGGMERAKTSENACRCAVTRAAPILCAAPWVSYLSNFNIKASRITGVGHRAPPITPRNSPEAQLSSESIGTNNFYN